MSYQPETGGKGLDSPVGGVPDRTSDVISLLEEGFQVSKRRVVTGKVRVSTRTETREESVEVPLEAVDVHIVRIAIDRVVDRAPDTRIDGDTTVVPVMEERFVLTRQLVLKEELHITRRVDRKTVRVPVQLRRQTAAIERLDGNGREATAVGDKP